MTGLVVFASQGSAAASGLCWRLRLRYDSVQSTMHSRIWVRCSLSCKTWLLLICKHTPCSAEQGSDVRQCAQGESIHPLAHAVCRMPALIGNHTDAGRTSKGNVQYNCNVDDTRGAASCLELALQMVHLEVHIGIEGGILLQAQQHGDKGVPNRSMLALPRNPGCYLCSDAVDSAMPDSEALGLTAITLVPANAACLTL